MPQKRTTRASRVTKVKLPKVDVAAELSGENYQEKLSYHISDFKSQVKDVLREFDKGKRTMFLTIQRHVEAQVAQIPSEVKHLTVKEFAAAGGQYEKVLGHVRNQKCASVEDTLRRIENLTCAVAPISTILEEPENDGETQKIVQKIKSKRACKSRMVRTPAVTPKFDPHLSTTPENIRDERPGERLILMSMAGTPVRRALQDDRKILEDNLASAGLNVTPKTMKRVLDTVSKTVTSFRR